MNLLFGSLLLLDSGLCLPIRFANKTIPSPAIIFQ